MGPALTFVDGSRAGRKRIQRLHRQQHAFCGVEQVRPDRWPTANRQPRHASDHLGHPPLAGTQPRRPPDPVRLPVNRGPSEGGRQGIAVTEDQAGQPRHAGRDQRRRTIVDHQRIRLEQAEDPLPCLDHSEQGHPVTEPGTHQFVGVALVMVGARREVVERLRRRHEGQSMPGQFAGPRLHVMDGEQHLMAQVAQLQRERQQAHQVGMPVPQFPAQQEPAHRRSPAAACTVRRPVRTPAPCRLEATRGSPRPRSPDSRSPRTGSRPMASA